jgi:hypothetical protein
MIPKDKNSYEYKMWFTGTGKGSGRRGVQGPNWLSLEEIGRSSRMVEFRVNDYKTRFVPLKDVEDWEAKEGDK